MNLREQGCRESEYSSQLLGSPDGLRAPGFLSTTAMLMQLIQ